MVFFPYQKEDQMYHNNNEIRVNLNGQFYLRKKPSQQKFESRISNKLNYKNYFYNTLFLDEINSFGFYGPIFNISLSTIFDSQEKNDWFIFPEVIINLLKSRIPSAQHYKLGLIKTTN